jgi:hypothetical protein
MWPGVHRAGLLKAEWLFLNLIVGGPGGGS